MHASMCDVCVLRIVLTKENKKTKLFVANENVVLNYGYRISNISNHRIYIEAFIHGIHTQMGMENFKWISGNAQMEFVRKIHTILRFDSLIT